MSKLQVTNAMLQAAKQRAIESKRLRESDAAKRDALGNKLLNEFDWLKAGYANKWEWLREKYGPIPNNEQLVAAFSEEFDREGLL